MLFRSVVNLLGISAEDAEHIEQVVITGFSIDDVLKKISRKLESEKEGSANRVKRFGCCIF